MIAHRLDNGAPSVHDLPSDPLSTASALGLERAARVRVSAFAHETASPRARAEVEITALRAGLFVSARRVMGLAFVCVRWARPHVVGGAFVRTFPEARQKKGGRRDRHPCNLACPELAEDAGARDFTRSHSPW